MFDADTDRACTTITIEDDTRHETTEEVFELILTTDDQDITLDPSTTTFTIIDDDGKARMFVRACVCVCACACVHKCVCGCVRTCMCV